MSRRPSSGVRAASTRRSTRSRHPAGGAADGRWMAAALADDRPADPEGLDRTEGGGRPPVEGTWRAHQVPITDARREPGALVSSRPWLRCYRPEELFDEQGRLEAELAALPRRGSGAWAPTRTQTVVSCSATSRSPTSPTTRSRSETRHDSSEATRVLGAFLRDVIARNPDRLPAVRPGRDRLEPPRRRLRGDRARLGGRAAPDRRGPRPGRTGDGGAVRAHVPGLARGLPADRSARPLQLLRGVHPHRRLDVQPARQVAQGVPRGSRGGGRSPRSTTCSRRTSGGRTTTASPTRTPGSSITW